LATEEQEQTVVRQEKLAKIRQLGFEPYPAKFARSHNLAELRQNFTALMEKEAVVSVAGRISTIRSHGKTCFLDIVDQDGRIQIYLRQDHLPAPEWELAQLLDIADFIGVSGTLMLTRTQEMTIYAEHLTLLCKALHLPPVVKETVNEGGEKVLHDAFSDKETRYRQRYLDLMVNPETKELFRIRAQMVAEMRNFLNGRGFLEVETPVLQPIYGGANARPFVTHHHTLDMNLYLRIADELYLKRLIIGGYDRVYEMSKDFRNEGVDRLHYPEFTQLELYQSFSDYNDMMALFESLLLHVADSVFGRREFEYKGKKFALQPPFARLSIPQALYEKLGADVMQASAKELFQLCKKRELPVEGGWEWEEYVKELVEGLLEPEIAEPTFILDFPQKLSPLAKPKADDPRLVERFEPFIMGVELGNAFSELNDPALQRANFQAQEASRGKGDAEAQAMDEDFITALEYGMPPTGGMGIGVDRLVMVFTDNPQIREVILFPQLKPKE
jgi:lysyl-tRNA synthetase class 2